MKNKRVQPPIKRWAHLVAQNPLISNPQILVNVPSMVHLKVPDLADTCPKTSSNLVKKPCTDVLAHGFLEKEH